MKSSSLWSSISHSLIIPICLVLFAQYFGSFPFTLHFSKHVISFLRYFYYSFLYNRIIGICSSEDVIPLTESLIFNSEIFRKQVLFNLHLMISFIIVAILCIFMKWLNTERIAACMEAILSVVYWIAEDNKEDPSINKTIQNIRNEEKELMMKLSSFMDLKDDSSTPSLETVSSLESTDSSNSPSSSPIPNDNSTSSIDKEEEHEDKEKLKLLKRIERKLSFLQKKRKSLLKIYERKQWIRKFTQGIVTSLSQFMSFILRHLSDILFCLVITCMTLASKIHIIYN